MNTLAPRITRQQQGAGATRATGRIRPAHNLERAAIAAVLQQSERFKNQDAARVVRSLWPDDLVTLRIVQRSAVNPASSSDSAWAGALAQQAVGDFIASLTDSSAGARLIAAGLTASLAGRQSVTLPRRTGAPGANTGWIAEGSPIPMRALSLASATLGPNRKLASITALTRETSESTDAENIIRTCLREDVAAALDASLFSTAAASATQPAGLLNGLTATTAVAGGDADATVGDFENLAAAIGAAGGIEPVFIMSPSQAISARLRLAGELPTIWASSAIANRTIIAIDPRGFASGFGTDPDITASNEAVIHAEDTTPAPISTAGTPNTVAAPVRSLFQTDCIALRCILDAAWVMRAPGLVAYVTGASWGPA